MIKTLPTIKTKAFLGLIFYIFISNNSFGQVANSYSFNSASGTYAPLSGITSTAFTGNWDDMVTANTISLGFTFEFNGVSYSSCSINSNGYLTFGTVTSLNNNFQPLSSTTGYSGVISGLGIDLINGGIDLVYKTIGTAPNRVFIVEWKNVKRYTARNDSSENFNFQIRLNETTNVVQIVYGTCTTNFSQDLLAEVGLRGTTNADFNNRKVTNNWPTSTTGFVNNETCKTGKGFGELPLSGLTYTWTPKILVTSFSSSSVCQGSSFTITGVNFTGTTAVSINNVTVSSFVVNSPTSITAIVSSVNTSGLVSVTNGSGTGKSTINLSVNSKPSIVVSPATATICTNALQPITATIAAPINAVIGTGSTTNTTTSYPAPYGAYYENVKQQYLIRASELTSSGLNSGSSINSISFDVSVLGVSGVHKAYTIGIGNTSQTAISTWEVGLTTVFGPVNYQPTNGVNKHVFFTSFVWDGTSNIIVQICHTNDATNSSVLWTENAQAKFSTTTFNSSLTYRVDNIDACGSNSVTITDVKRPNMVLSTVSPVVSWLPITDLFNDASGTIPYSGANLVTVYANPSVNRIYTATATSPYGCVSSGTSTFNTPITNTWNGSVWSTGVVPTSTEKIVFSANYPPTVDPNVDIDGCSCQINGGVNVTIKSGRTLKISNEVTVIGVGTLTFENNASLVQVNDNAINTGNVVYKRLTSPISNLDFVYWSSPVFPQTLKALSPNTLSDKYFSFDASIENWKQENPLNNMSKGTGYIIRGPQNYASPTPPGFFQGSFIGVPNNGLINIPIFGINASNLIGNPYPSALNADAFLIANNTILDGTIYFWTHNTAIGLSTGVSNPGSGAYAYSSDDYASYNLTGGVGTAEAISDPTPGDPNDNKPTGKIASGQGFFVTSINPGTVTFNNSMRLNGLSGNNAQFFKSVSSSKSTNEVEKHRLWLNLTNSQGAFKQTLVGYIKGATNEYDNAYDGESFDGNAFIDFYSIYQGKNLVIQGRALPFEEIDEVPLGYHTTISGDFKISIDQLDGILESKEVFIEDKFLDKIHNLKNEPYLFSTEIGVFDNRFLLRYTNKTLGNNDFEMLDSSVLIYNKNKEIMINSSVGEIQEIVVYDLLGKQLYEMTNIYNTSFKISNLKVSQQILLVKVILQDGQVVSKKIIY